MKEAFEARVFGLGLIVCLGLLGVFVLGPFLLFGVSFACDLFAFCVSLFACVCLCVAFWRFCFVCVLRLFFEVSVLRCGFCSLVFLCCVCVAVRCSCCAALVLVSRSVFVSVL